VNDGIPTRPKSRYGQEQQRAQLASVDLLTIEDSAAKAGTALRNGDMSVALDHLENVKKALTRAQRMIRTGK
jgi:hypothetical protein